MTRVRQSVDLETFAADWSGIQLEDLADEELAQVFLDTFNVNMPKLANAYIKTIDSDLAVATLTKRTVAWAEDWSEELGRLMKLTTHNEVGRLLAANLQTGASVHDFAQALMNSGIRDEYFRARRASLTEMLRAHSVAQQEAIVQNPAVDDKEWVHTGNHRNEPRENHEAISGQIVPKGQPFILPGIKGGTHTPMYPRDSVLPPEESINCHCIHRGIANADVLGLSLEERRQMQADIIAADDGEWEQELDARNRAKAGIDISPVSVDNTLMGTREGLGFAHDV